MSANFNQTALTKTPYERYDLLKVPSAREEQSSGALRAIPPSHPAPFIVAAMLPTVAMEAQVLSIISVLPGSIHVLYHGRNLARNADRSTSAPSATLIYKIHAAVPASFHGNSGPATSAGRKGAR